MAGRDCSCVTLPSDQEEEEEGGEGGGRGVRGGGEAGDEKRAYFSTRQHRFLEASQASNHCTSSKSNM